MHFQDWPLGIYVTFSDTQQKKLGRTWRFSDESKVFDILRASRCPVEDHNLVERAFVERRPGRVTLQLTDEQYQRLVEGK